jgi:hypothetical protein
MKTLIPLCLWIALMAGCSCTTSLSSKSQEQSSPSELNPSTSPEARVQGQWQARFQFAVADAGHTAEGWALFADSPMGHTGQQMVVKFPDGTVKVCYAAQATNDCTYQVLDSAKFQNLIAATTIGDGISDRPLQTFDTLNLEYVHIKNTSGVVNTTARVFFMVDHKKLPADYDKLMDSFTSLNK